MSALDQAGAVNGDPRCPLCGAPLYGWILLPAAGEPLGVGMARDTPGAAERVILRCEDCGLALERDRPVDLESEWEALAAVSPPGTVVAPNRAGLQAAIGVEGWAGIDAGPGALMLAPRSLELLAERAGTRLEKVRTPPTRRGQAWMWQTLVNGLTFHPNFAREVRGGRLRAANARRRWMFALDAVVTVLAAPLVLLVSLPLELAAAAAGRGGELRARITRA
jgi:hypothetical protein